MKDAMISIGSALVGSFLIWIIKSIYQYFRYYRNSKYSGVWNDNIYDENGNIIKKDVFIIKHNKRTHQVTGKINRVFPLEQTHRKWKCSGIITNNHFILSFWSDDLIMSDGCVYTVLVDDYTYEGYYLRGTKDKIHKVKIRLTKEER